MTIPNANFRPLAQAISPWLNEEERILEIGEANWVSASQQLGRGAGEGILTLTDSRVHFLRKDSKHSAFSRDQIAEARKSFIMVPNFTELHFEVLGDDRQWQNLSFYCTKRTAKGFLRELKKQPSKAVIQGRAADSLAQLLEDLSLMYCVGQTPESDPRRLIPSLDNKQLRFVDEQGEVASFDLEQKFFQVQSFDDISGYLSLVEDNRYGMPNRRILEIVGDTSTPAIKILDQNGCYWFLDEQARLSQFRGFLCGFAGASTLGKIPQDPSREQVDDIVLKVAVALGISPNEAALLPRMIHVIDGLDAGDYAIKVIQEQSYWRIHHVPGEPLSTKYYPVKVDLSTVADWDLLHTGTGFSLFRMAVFKEGVDTSGDFEEAAGRPNDWLLDISVAWGTAEQKEFLDRLIELINRFGCFEPNSRDFNVLSRPLGQSSLEW